MDRRKTRITRDPHDKTTTSPDQLFHAAYKVWEFTLESFNLSPDQLCQHIELVDPARARQSKPVISWCPVTHLVAARHQLQKSLELGDFPRTLSQITGHKYSWGVTLTAPYLWQARRDPELTAAILLEASLFARMGNSRAEYPHDNWPAIAEVGASRAAIRQFIEAGLENYEGWPHMCTTVLPVRSEDLWYKIGEPCALWRYLAEEHARLYRQYRILKIDFVESESEERFAILDGA